MKSSPTPTPSPKSFLKEPGLYLIITVTIIGALIASLFHFRSWVVAAIVNGRPVTRYQLVKQMEQRIGSEILNGVIDHMLVDQYARQNNVTVSTEQVDQRILDIRKSFVGNDLTLDQSLAQQGLTLDDFRRQIRTELLLDAIIGQNFTVPESLIDEAIETNTYPLPTNLPIEEQRDYIRQLLIDELIRDETETWLQHQRDQANIRFFVDYQ